jgi:acyl-CoA synthetase (AMP-forming)/AMP-acid ligase II
MDAPAQTPGFHAARDPQRPAIVMAGSGEVVTYAELESRTARAARALRAAGLRPGDHVALLLDNRAAMLELAWAAQRSGLYYTPINTRLAADEAAYVVDDCGATVLFASASVARLAEEVRDRVPEVARFVAVDGEIDGFEPLAVFVAGVDAEPLDDEREGSPMLYSSGTTGRPKGVRRLTTGQPYGTDNPVGPLLQGVMGFAPGKVYLTPAPLYHSAPLVWSMTVHRVGGTLVLMERFDAQACLDVIDRERVTHAQFVPTMFVRMLKLPDDARAAFDGSSLESVVHAAAPCPVEVKRQMIGWWGPIVSEYYAGTEGGGLTWIDSADWLARPGSVGRAAWGEIHICAESGEELPLGEPGVVRFGGGANAFEYHHDPEKTRQTFDERGWSTLWDVGYLDADGYLFLTDRLTYMIVSGGVNIYPQEVEDHLLLHPKVTDAAVFGVPDPDLGEQVKAVVQPAAGVAAGPELEDELLAYCRDGLAHYKCPRSVDFEAELPRGDNGKLYKRVLRDRYWAGHDTRLL